jgi:hypothetical protein
MPCAPRTDSTWPRWHSAWWIACAIGMAAGVRQAVPGGHLEACDPGIPGQGVPARAQVPGQAGQRFQRNLPGGQRVGRPLAGGRREIALVRRNQVVQRSPDRPVRSRRREVEHFRIHAL